MNYLLFCEECGLPKTITNHIMKEYFWIVNRTYCEHCQNRMTVPYEIQLASRKLRWEEKK